MATFVQFNSAAEVLEAFNSRGIDTWSICQGKDLIAAGSGTEELQSFLELLSKGRYPVVYTLRVYNGAGDPDSITNKTECNGSFKFQLETAEGVPAAVSGTRFAGTDIITQRIHGVISDKVGKYVDDLLSGKEQEEKKPSLKDVALGYLENPEDLGQLVGAISGIVQMFKGGAAPAMVAGPRLPASFAGTAPAGPAEPSQAERDALGARLVAAVNRLEKCDPEIVLHLEQLATVAEQKPALYKMALGFLNQ